MVTRKTQISKPHTTNHKPQTTDLENADLENADLEDADLENILCTNREVSSFYTQWDIEKSGKPETTIGSSLLIN